MQRAESVIGAIFSSDRSKVLLVKRRDVPVWVLPGGGVEEENPEDAIIREILEETGFRVKIKRLVGLYLPINALTRTTLLYECAIESGEATCSSETQEVRFFSLQTLPKLIPPPFTDWILDAFIQQKTIEKKLTQITYTALVFSLLKHPILGFLFLKSKIIKKLF